ncbi:hypothetical protein, partial [Pseudomonas savastanoi]|uniref:hypothetical protein n=1 Tax=Pseudomonas savastanoi TaxID=29438 RepID=UPI001F1C1E4D
MAVIGFSVIRYVDPFQGGGILLENNREYKVQPELHTRCMANAGKKNRAHSPVFRLAATDSVNDLT